MKRLPASLKTFLANNPNCVKADCFAITLPTGQVLYATEGQWDITFLGNTPGWSGGQVTFLSSQYGLWSRGAITSEASTKVQSNTMSLTCKPQPTTTYPGLNIGILSAALNRLFDAATVWVYTAYMPSNQYGNVSAGIETKFQGTITKAPKLRRNLVTFECADPLFMLNMKVPSRLFQSNCPWSFCDVNCTLNAANYTVNLTAAAGSNQNTIVPSAVLSQAAGYFAQGVIKCLTGENAGLSQTVKQHANGNIIVMAPWVLPIAAGDTFAVIKGCDKTAGTCAGTLQANGTAEPNNWQTRFGGMPFVPPATSAI